jgi:hypothetical protein
VRTLTWLESLVERVGGPTGRQGSLGRQEGLTVWEVAEITGAVADMIL